MPRPYDGIMARSWKRYLLTVLLATAAEAQTAAPSRKQPAHSEVRVRVSHPFRQSRKYTMARAT